MKTVLVYKNTEESINELQYDVSNAVNNIAINNDLLGNPNDSYNSLENILMEAKSKHFQPREIRFDKYKHKFSPWISSGIIHSIKYRYSLYSKNWRRQMFKHQSIMSCQIIYAYTTQYLKQTLD